MRVSQAEGAVAWQFQRTGLLRIAAASEEEADAVMVRKTASFLEFSLCLSRACLGKMIVYTYKWLKNAVFAGAGN
jgi:hypothetical protein